MRPSFLDPARERPLLRAAGVLLGALLTLAAPARAAFDKGGVLGIGARPMGMGGAFVAVADDSDAGWWNPAGLTQLQRKEVGAFYGPLLNGKEYYASASVAIPFLEQTALGLTVVDLFHNTGNADTQASEYTYIGSLATPLNAEKTVSVGVNLKFLNYDSAATAIDPLTGQTLEGKASGMGMDLGVLYQVILPTWGKRLNFGFMAQDLDTVLHWQSGVEERVAQVIQAGAAYYPEENLLFTADFSFFNDPNISAPETSQTRPHVGMEGWFFDRHLGLRAGYTGFVTMPDRFTGGISYRQDWFGVDYAYMGHAEHLGDSHRLSAHLSFGSASARTRAVTLVRPPLNLSATPQQNGAELRWDKNPDPHVTGYNIYMSRMSGSGYELVKRHSQDNQALVENLNNGSAYYFVVTSLNDSWPAVESKYSEEVEVMAGAVAPDAPKLAKPMRRGTGRLPAKLPVEFLMQNKSYKGFNIYASPRRGELGNLLNTEPITEAFPALDLEPGKTYFVRIQVVLTDGKLGKIGDAKEMVIQSAGPGK